MLIPIMAHRVKTEPSPIQLLQATVTLQSGNTLALAVTLLNSFKGSLYDLSSLAP